MTVKPSKYTKCRKTFAVFWILLVSHGLRQSIHDVELFQRQYSQTLDESCETIRCPASLPVIVRLQQQRQQIVNQVGSIRLNRRN